MYMHRKLHKHFVPSHLNSYRPYILRKQGLLFFIALILFSEGMFVSGVFIGTEPAQNLSIGSSEPREGFASASATEVVAAAALPGTSFFNSIAKELGRIAVDSKPFVPWALGLIGIILTIGVLFAFFIHVQIQQPEMLFSGALVAMFAFSLMVTNIHVLGML